MTVIENFLNENHFKALQNYCLTTKFEIVKAADKEFSVIPVLPSLRRVLEIPGYEMTLTFIRNAHADFDTDIRIHADNIIMNKKTDLASVLYINPEKGVTKNGTAFWKHHIHGLELPKDVSNEEFDRLITEDSNNLSKWELQEVVWSKPNTRVIYNANLFHSKYPAQITNGTRIVAVAFYSKIN